MKYFVISDIHSFFDEMMESLNKAGYQKDNPNHFLIVLGDIFDRGSQPLEVFLYLKSIPKDRRILVRGNHEWLLRKFIDRGFPVQIDFYNGLVETFKEILDITFQQFEDFPELYIEEYKALGILDWINSDEWVDYYELPDYLFVHAWYPFDMFKPSNWRECATLSDWEHATWDLPYEQYNLCRLVNDPTLEKTIVCGHRHTRYFRKYFRCENTDSYSIFKLDKIIGIDACTALSGQCNVLIIEEGQPLRDQNGNEVVDEKTDYYIDKSQLTEE